MENDYYRTLSERLTSCRSRLMERQKEIAPILQRESLSLAGFGNKGRPLALYLRDKLEKRVTVYDATPRGRAAAAAAGFDVYESAEEVDDSHAVILSATQHQSEQATQFPRNHVFHEEAGYFFNVPFVFNYSQDFSSWILDNWDDVLGFVAGLPVQPRDALASILAFRLSLDPEELDGARRPVSGMWFDIPSEFKHRAYRCFLDVGAFDGDTLQAGVEWKFGFTKAIAIEANSDFRDKILGRSKLFSEGLEVVPFAAWSKTCRLTATEDFSGMVTVTESESGPISARALDDVVSGDVDFLKIDIEGAEASALAGARDILARGTDLAIAAYHRPGDIMDLYNFVAENLGSFDSYNMYVAHYSGCLDDTILYFLADR